MFYLIRINAGKHFHLIPGATWNEGTGEIQFGLRQAISRYIHTILAQDLVRMVSEGQDPINEDGLYIESIKVAETPKGRLLMDDYVVLTSLSGQTNSEQINIKIGDVIVDDEHRVADLRLHEEHDVLCLVDPLVCDVYTGLNDNHRRQFPMMLLAFAQAAAKEEMRRVK